MSGWKEAVTPLLIGMIIGVGGPLGGGTILALGLFAVCLLRPDVGFAWSLAFLPLSLPHIPIAQVQIQPFEMIVWPATAVAIAKSLQERVKITPNDLRRLTPLVVLGAYLALIGLVLWGTRTPLELRMWGGALVFALATYLRSASPTFLANVPRALTASAVGLLALGVSQHLFGAPGFQGVEESRDLFQLLIFGSSSTVRLANLTFDHFNSAGGYTALLTVTLVAIATVQRRATSVWIGTAASAIALYLTYSRGAALAALVGILTIVLLISGRKVRVVAALGFIGIAAIVLIRIVPRVLATDYAATLSLGTRALIWGAYLAAWRTSPLFGLGPGNGFDMVQFLSPYGSQYGAHSNYLYLGADYGIVGLLTVVMCLGSVIVRCLRLSRAERKAAPFALAATGILAGLAVHSIFDDTLAIFSYRVALLGLIGIALRQSNHQSLNSAHGLTVSSEQGVG